MDDYDIYEDLEEVDYKAENEKLQAEIENLKQRLVEEQKRCTELVTANETLKTNEVNYRKNFSSLLLTARTEVDRKDRQLAEARNKSTSVNKEISSNAPQKRSKSTQTEETLEIVRRKTDSQPNGGVKRRSRSPRDKYEPATKRLKNSSDERRGGDDKHEARRRVEDRRDNDRSRDYKRDDAKYRRRSTERKQETTRKRDDHRSRETRSSERVKKEDEEKLKKREKSPTKLSKKDVVPKAEVQEDVKTQPDVVTIQKDENPTPHPELPVLLVLDEPPEKCQATKDPPLTQLPDTGQPTATVLELEPLPQPVEKCDQSTTNDDVKKTDDTNPTQQTVDTDPNSVIDGPTKCTKPSDTHQIVESDELNTQQQMCPNVPSNKEEATTPPEKTINIEPTEATVNESSLNQSGRNYVVEVVNENEFECFVSRKRKKKKTKA